VKAMLGGLQAWEDAGYPVKLSDADGLG